MNPNDEIRRNILQYFYDRNATATSHMGKKGAAIKISDVKRQLKERFGLKQQEVMSNLTYLIDNGWVKTIDIEKTVHTKGGTVPSVTTYYQITAKGIDRVEGGSQFEPRERYAGINIRATGSNFITLGDGNVVNAQYSELHSELNSLKAAISATNDLSDSEKLSYAADIESIKDQLAKPEPHKTIIQHLWSGLKVVATISSVAAAYAKVLPLIKGLLQ
jgi:hypothetical protein